MMMIIAGLFRSFKIVSLYILPRHIRNTWKLLGEEFIQVANTWKTSFFILSRGCNVKFII